MLKKLVVVSVGVALFALPVAVSAQAAPNQALLESLLAQLATLQAKITQLQEQPAPNDVESKKTIAVGAQCLDLLRNIGPDDTDTTTDSAVSTLQAFLVSNNLLDSKLPHGYFGPSTMRAVQAWQKSHNLLSAGDPDSNGYGFVGPKTRDVMACKKSAPSESGNVIRAFKVEFSAAVNGSESMAAVFSAKLPQIDYKALRYGVDFGDGSRPELLACQEEGPCPLANISYFRHTYAAPGTYVATLFTMPARQCAWDLGQCTDRKTLSTASVTLSKTVGSPSITVRSVEPNAIGTHVNTEYSNLSAGWRMRVIGVSGQSNALPNTSISILPLPGSYTGNSIRDFTVPDKTGSVSLILPQNAPAGTYVVEVSDPTSGWVIKLRSGAFVVPEAARPTPLISAFTASASSVVPLQPVTLTLNATGVTNCRVASYDASTGAKINDLPGYAVDSAGSVNAGLMVTPDHNITYTVTCGSDNGTTVTKSVTVKSGGPTVVPSPVGSITSADDFVRYLYRCALGGEGDQSGVAGRVSRLTSGAVTIQGMYPEFFIAAQYQSRNLDNTHFVSDLYHCVLFREGEPSGIASRSQALSTQSRADALNELLSGPEFMQSVLPVLQRAISSGQLLMMTTPNTGSQSVNLANALSALESALNGILSKLGR